MQSLQMNGVETIIQVFWYKNSRHPAGVFVDDDSSLKS